MNTSATFAAAFCISVCVASFVNCRKASKEVLTTQIRGAALAHVHVRGKGYGSGTSAALLKRLSLHGINLIQLNPFGYQPAVHDRRILFNDATLSDEDLKREIQAVHANGMKVMLAPHIWLDQRHNAPWRSQLDYQNPDEILQWFAAYEKFILHYANIARETKAEIFAVGVELERLAKNADAFRRIIRNVRANGYAGLITYECEAWNAENIAFWDDLDFIGLNMYYAFGAEPRTESDHKFHELVAFQQQKLLFHARHAQRLGKPWIITEFGYPAHDKAISQTSAWPDRMQARDDQAQYIGFRAMEFALTHMKDQAPPQAAGIIFWKYVTTLDSYEAKNYATDFILQGKPAEKVLLRMAQRNEHRPAE